MTSSIIASTNRAISIKGFRITEMGVDTWSNGDVQDGKNDPAASNLRLKVDVDIQEVYREADNIFRFMLDARVAIAHKSESTEPCHALAEEQRGKLKSKLRHLAQLEVGAEQMDSDQFRPAYLLDSVRERGGADHDFGNLQKLLWISAFSRVGTIYFDQNHGPETFVLSYLDGKVLEDMVLKIFSHLEEKWLNEKGLQFLGDMPIDSKHSNEGPSNAGLMASSEAFAVVVVGTELRIQLDV